jgi:uncharacterized membrane protein YhaH (DUF805 family)
LAAFSLNTSPGTYWISVGVALLPATLSMTASGAKHDRDLSGWRLPGFLTLAAAILEAYFLIFDQQFVMGGPFMFGIWGAAIWLVARTPGTVGPNRFGPDPRWTDRRCQGTMAPDVGCES